MSDQAEESALPPTAYAVLGTLAFGRELSGYDIKKWADASLGFFYWSPALSHIYRELARLEERALVEGIDVPSAPRSGGRSGSLRPVEMRWPHGWGSPTASRRS